MVVLDIQEENPLGEIPGSPWVNKWGVYSAALDGPRNAVSCIKAAHGHGRVYTVIKGISGNRNALFPSFLHAAVMRGCGNRPHFPDKWAVLCCLALQGPGATQTRRGDVKFWL